MPEEERRLAMHKFSEYYFDQGVEIAAGNYLFNLWKTQDYYALRSLVFLCIGSDRYTGDALGPLVGSYLLEQLDDAIVYGSLENPVHAGNLTTVAGEIFRHYDRPLIVAVDACLGKKSEIGKLEIWEGGIEAGIAVGNRLPKVGDIAVIGIVNCTSQVGYLDLQSTPLSLVIKQARLLAQIFASFYEVVRQQMIAASTQETNAPNLSIK